MKQMRTPLTPTRLARCTAIIEGFGESRADRALRDMFLQRQFAFVDMITDEAIELLAFRLIGDHADGNRRAARIKIVPNLKDWRTAAAQEQRANRRMGDDE